MISVAFDAGLRLERFTFPAQTTTKMMATTTVVTSRPPTVEATATTVLMRALALLVQSSVSVLLIEASFLKYPAAHAVQLGCTVAEPGSSVYLPAGHFVWEIHESVVMLLLDRVSLKNPVLHVLHWG